MKLGMKRFFYVFDIIGSILIFVFLSFPFFYLGSTLFNGYELVGICFYPPLYNIFRLYPVQFELISLTMLIFLACITTILILGVLGIFNSFSKNRETKKSIIIFRTVNWLLLLQLMLIFIIDIISISMRSQIRASIAPSSYLVIFYILFFVGAGVQIALLILFLKNRKKQKSGIVERNIEQLEK